MAEYEQKKLARRELGVGGKPAAAAALPFPKVAEAEAAEAGAEEGDDGRVTLEKVLGGGEGVPESVKRIAECCASLRSPAAKLGGGAPASPAFPASLYLLARRLRTRANLAPFQSNTTPPGSA